MVGFKRLWGKSDLKTLTRLVYRYHQVDYSNCETQISGGLKEREANRKLSKSRYQGHKVARRKPFAAARVAQKQFGPVHFVQVCKRYADK